MIFSKLVVTTGAPGLYTPPDVNTIGTFVLKRCSLPPVEIPAPRCSPHPDGETYPTPHAFVALDATQCGALLAGVGTCVAGMVGDYAAAVECCAEIEKFSDGGCVCSNCDDACGAVVAQAKDMCQGFRVSDKSSCPAPVFANATTECQWKYGNFLTQFAKYSSETDATQQATEGFAMCVQAAALDTGKCHCLNAADTGVNATFLALVNFNCAKQADPALTSKNLTACAASPPPAPASVAGNASTSTCSALYADYGGKCAAAAAAQAAGAADYLTKAVACCAAAVPFAADNCSCTSPPFGTISDFHQGGGGGHMRAHAQCVSVSVPGECCGEKRAS